MPLAPGHHSGGDRPAGHMRGADQGLPHRRPCAGARRRGAGPHGVTTVAANATVATPPSVVQALRPQPAADGDGRLRPTLRPQPRPPPGSPLRPRRRPAALPAPGSTTVTSRGGSGHRGRSAVVTPISRRSEEHTSELQSRQYLVCRLLLEKKKYIPVYSSTFIFSLPLLSLTSFPSFTPPLFFSLISFRYFLSHLICVSPTFSTFPYFTLPF